MRDVSSLDAAIAGRLKRDDSGLVPAVVQDATSRAVLMVGWMDDEALHRTLTTGRSTFWSRSRGEYWVKGETSGHTQHVREVRLSAGAGFVVAVCGDVMTMPGLPAKPAAGRIDLTDEGEILGLS